MVRSRDTRVFSPLPVRRRFRYSSRTMNWECEVWGGQSVTDCGIPSEASTGAPRDKCQTVWSETLLHPVLIYIAPQANRFLNWRDARTHWPEPYRWCRSAGSDGPIYPHLPYSWVRGLHDCQPAPHKGMCGWNKGAVLTEGPRQCVWSRCPTASQMQI